MAHAGSDLRDYGTGHMPRPQPQLQVARASLLEHGCLGFWENHAAGFISTIDTQLAAWMEATRFKSRTGSSSLSAGKPWVHFQDFNQRY